MPIKEKETQELLKQAEQEKATCKTSKTKDYEALALMAFKTAK